VRSSREGGNRRQETRGRRCNQRIFSNFAVLDSFGMAAIVQPHEMHLVTYGANTKILSLNTG